MGGCCYIYSIRTPKGGHRRPIILRLGKLGSGRLAKVAVAPWREDCRLKLTGRRSAALVFGIGSRHALGKFWASSRHLWDRKNKAVASHNAPAVGSGWRPLGTKSHQNPTKNGAQSRAKTMQNQNRRKIALKSPPRASFWASVQTFWEHLGSILAPKTRQRGWKKADKNSVNF